MKFFIVFLALFAVTLAATEEEEEAWVAFKVDHGKLFLSPGKEKARKSIFLDNFREAKEHNEAFERGEYSYPKTIGRTADLAKEEFKKRFTGIRVPENYKPDEGEAVTLRQKAPVRMDLRGQAGASPIKDQNPCGSCWAFSTLGAVENNYYKKHNNETLDLSEEMLVDCVYDNYNGCDGGWMADSMDYMGENPIATEAEYPYTFPKKSSTCRKERAVQRKVLMNTKTNIKIRDNDTSIKNALNQHGVLAICVDATDWEYLYGFKKVFTHKRPNQVTCEHAVNLVGYDTMKGSDGKPVPVWIVKNSWNTDWGDQGYIYIDARRDTKTKKNLGGFLTNFVWAANVK